MNRRRFFKGLALASAASLVLPKAAFAKHKHIHAGDMAGGVFLTKEKPGRWAKKVSGHFPLVEVKGKTVKVTTPHSMSGFKHYIVKHQILDKDFNFITEKMFDPTKDKSPISEFDLGSYSGDIYVLSVCNKHDTWMASANV